MRPGEEIYDYREKRGLVLRSPVHLVEVDLLRGGERPGSEVEEPALDADYVVLVNHANGRDLRTPEADRAVGSPAGDSGSSPGARP